MSALRGPVLQTSTTLRRAFQPYHLHSVARQLRRLSSSIERTPPAHTRRHFEKRLVPFPQSEVYSVVSDVNSYHAFVPWCTSSLITRHIDDTHLIADLSVGFRLLSERYTSVITLSPLQSVSVDVPHSTLFDYLITDWTFEQQASNSTLLTFYVEFAFRNRLYQRVTDLFFEEVVKQMVSAFEQRCHDKFPLHERRPGILHRW